MTVMEGLGYGLVNLFTDSGSKNIEDYQLRYFQLGESVASGTYTDTSNVLYELSSALVFASSYGSASPFIATALDQIVKTPSGPGGGAFVTSSNILVDLGQATTTNFEKGYTRILLNLKGKTPQPGLTIQEIGLFMKNPDGRKDKDKPVLVAYKYLKHPINTSTELGIVLDWIITFLGS